MVSAISDPTVLTSERWYACRRIMSGVRIVAIVLIVAGIAGLVYDRFSYTKETHEVDLGPIELEVKEKQTVNVPRWAGIAAIAAGVLLFVVPRRRTS